MNRDAGVRAGRRRRGLLFSVAALLAACGGGGDEGGAGGGGGSGTTSVAGVFKDSNVAGLEYLSGNRQGVTGAGGGYLCESGGSVTFSLGSVTLGSVACGPVVTPLDLVTNGTTATLAVQNIARLLQSLDRDADPANGVEILAAVRDGITWPVLDFDSDLGVELADIVAQAASIDAGGSYAVVSTAAAQGHLEQTLRCAYSGAYDAFVDVLSPNNPIHATDLGFVVDAATGLVNGAGADFFAVNNPAGFTPFVVTGTSPVGFDQSASFTATATAIGATLAGRVTTAGDIAGGWTTADGTRPLLSNVGRFEPTDAPRYRFGLLLGETAADGSSGVVTLDVSAANAVSLLGLAPIAHARIVSTSGTLSGTSLNLTGRLIDLNSGATVNLTLSGNLDTTGGSFSGTWSTDGPAAASGPASGSGCRLN